MFRELIFTINHINDCNKGRKDSVQKTDLLHYVQIKGNLLILGGKVRCQQIFYLPVYVLFMEFFKNYSFWIFSHFANLLPITKLADMSHFCFSDDDCVSKSNV